MNDDRLEQSQRLDLDVGKALANDVGNGDGDDGDGLNPNSNPKNPHLEQQKMRMEKRAQQIVTTITSCIDSIRTINAFQPITIKNQMKSTPGSQLKKRGVQDDDDDDGVVYLYHHLCAKGIQSQVDAIRFDLFEEDETGLRSQDETGRTISKLNNTCMSQSSSGEFTYQYMNPDSVKIFPCHEMEHDRYQVIHKIFLPLLSALATCYEKIDAMDDVDNADTQDENDDDDDSDSDRAGKDHAIAPIHMNMRTRSSRKKKKPDAPIGLLSLTNYTDIACLLELTVCTSILPLLEKNVTTHAKERVNYLPRSLRGRLQNKSLQWGMETLSYKIPMDGASASDGDGDGDGAMKKSEKKRNSNSKHLMAIQKIDRASRELSHTIVTICRVILLHRFRPMLLPRLATDVYAVIFQLERLTGIRQNILIQGGLGCGGSGSGSGDRDGSDSHGHLHYNLMLLRRLFLHEHNPSLTVKHIGDDASKLHEPIDFHTMVKSYQCLLLIGKHAPSWLRSRVGNLLTALGTKTQDGLRAIIDVFVLAASLLPTEQITGASSRLGRVLCAKSTNGHNSATEKYYKELFGQFVSLLEFRGMNLSEISTGADTQVVATIMTTWAVMENVPIEMLQKLFFPLLVDGLVPPEIGSSTGSNSVHTSIRRIHSLLLFTPVGGKTIEAFCSFLLSEVNCFSQWNMLTPIGQLVRAVCATGETLLSCDAVIEVEATIDLIMYTVFQKCTQINSKRGVKVSVDSFMAVSLVQSVVTNSFDKLGYLFERTSSSTGTNGAELRIIRNNADQSHALLSGIESRASFIIGKIIASRSDSEGPEAGEKKREESLSSSYLASATFKLLLLIYFESTRNAEGARYLPAFMMDNLDDFKLVSMMMLSPLCEKCPPEGLLAERPGSDVGGIIQIIILILKSTTLQSVSGTENSDHEKDVKLENGQCDFSTCEISSQVFNAPLASGTDSSYMDVDIETRLSITSVVLSLLVAILELGSQQRSQAEETSLKILLPHLNILSNLGEIPFQELKGEKESTSRYNHASSALKAEIAEMSTHAMALIHARSMQPSTVGKSISSPLPTLDHFKTSLEEVKMQLSSDQPPIRARAVVQLRKLVRGSLRDQMHSSETKSREPLIVELSEIGDHSTTNERPSDFLQNIDDLVYVSLLSLEDTESYVYLAGIQTLVAIVDEFPILCMPLLINAVRSGYLDLQHCTLSNVVRYKLSPAQRIKLTEAIMFMVRRRGAAIQSYSSQLLSIFLYGRDTSHANHNDSNENTEKIVQIETQKYFQGSDHVHAEDEEEMDPKEKLNDLRIRVNTGGPVFDTEEKDVVRAACINILSELISVLHPNTIAPYCQPLVRLGTDALTLDQSRIVRRSVALLCRELYSCALREAESNQDGESAPAGIDFLLSLLSNGESKLETTLQACCDRVLGVNRLFDHATIARCEEALQVRTILEKCGIISGAAIILEAKRRDDRNPVAQLLSREIMKTPIKHTPAFNHFDTAE